MRKIKSSIFPFQIDPRHYYMHDYLTFCNDVLVSILKYSDENNISSSTLQFQNKTDLIAFEQVVKTSGDWQEWLLNHGHREEMYTAYFKHILFSLVADFCNYMLESINCAAKMKIAVSYALLRKPLKDTLGYIEWLYIDRDELLDLLVSGKPEDLIIRKEKALKHTSIIEEKYGKSSYFDFRYNKTSETSLEHIWNNANHLVTTKYRLSKTAPGNLNFVFTDESELRSFSDYYYITVPYIMSYAVDIICEMFEDFAGLNEYTILMNKLNRSIKSLILIENPSLSEIRQLCMNGDVPIICPRCGLKLKMTDKRIIKLLQNRCICIRCRKKIDTNTYIFDWEK